MSIMRNYQGFESLTRLDLRMMEFILAAKKLWVRLALCTMSIVTSARNTPQPVFGLKDLASKTLGL